MLSDLKTAWIPLAATAGRAPEWPVCRHEAWPPTPAVGAVWAQPQVSRYCCLPADSFHSSRVRSRSTRLQRYRRHESTLTSRSSTERPHPAKCQHSPVGVQCKGFYRDGGTRQGPDVPTTCDVPQDHGTIVVSCGEGAPVRAEGDGIDRVGVTGQGPTAPARVDVPYGDRRQPVFTHALAGHCPRCLATQAALDRDAAGIRGDVGLEAAAGHRPEQDSGRGDVHLQRRARV